MANSGRNSGRTSLAATRALTDWATSGAVWLLVLSTTAVTTATAVVMAAGIGAAVVILTVLQRGYVVQGGGGPRLRASHRDAGDACSAGRPSSFSTRRSIEGSGVRCWRLHWQRERCRPGASWSTERGPAAGPRVVRRPGHRAGRRERRDRRPRPDHRACRGGLDDPRLRRGLRTGGRGVGGWPTSVRATISCRRCRPPARRSSSRRPTRSGASPPTPNSSRSGEPEPTCACTPDCAASTIVRSARPRSDTTRCSASTCRGSSASNDSSSDCST